MNGYARFGDLDSDRIRNSGCCASFSTRHLPFPGYAVYEFIPRYSLPNHTLSSWSNIVRFPVKSKLDQELHKNWLEIAFDAHKCLIDRSSPSLPVFRGANAVIHYTFHGVSFWLR